MRLFLVDVILVVWLFSVSVVNMATLATTDSTEDISSKHLTTEYSESTEYYEYDTTAEAEAPSKKRKVVLSTNTILFAMAGALLLSGCIVSFSLWMLSRRARAKMLGEEGTGISPRKMGSEAINLSEFQAKGPLVLQARMKGRIKHALDDEKSFSLREIQFDPKYNEICIIGSDVEQLEGMSQLSMLSGEKSAEAIKIMKKGNYPTMASEAKKQQAEAAAREAQRVRENERRIAESAIRRRAKDEAAAAAATAAATQSKSETSKQSDPKTESRLHSPKSEQSQVNLEKTQASVRSRLDSVQSLQSSPYQSRNPQHDTKKTRPPVTTRKKPSNDGRNPDALGATSNRMKSNTSGSNRTAEDSRSQKTTRSSSSDVKSGDAASQLRKIGN